MIDASYYELAKSNLTIISGINKYVSEKINPFTTDNLECGVLLTRNREADIIFKEITTTPSVYWLDRYFAFWVYEISHSASDSINSYNGLIRKFVSLRKQIIGNARDEAKAFIDLQPIDTVLSQYNLIRDTYVRKLDEVIILTAVPEEFKAVIRKFSIIVNVFNRNAIEEILNPDTDPDTIKKRKKTWVEGVVHRDNKFVKVRLVLTEEYGSVASVDSLSHITDEYIFQNEILVVGIAGHLDKEEKVKIGDLVISDSYYNAYLQKDIQLSDVVSSVVNTVSYNDKVLKLLSDDYNVHGKFDWEKWKPTKMVVSHPEVLSKERHSVTTTVHKGSIVSGPSVVKQDFKKEVLQQNFEKALAIEMEAHGCYSFVKNHKNLKLKVIKGVCDWADHEKEDNWQPFCADLAAEFAIDYLIAKYGK